MFVLDTHTLLWFLRDSSELPSEAKTMIQQADVVAVSIASFWEIAIKNISSPQTQSNCNLLMFSN